MAKRTCGTCAHYDACLEGKHDGCEYHDNRATLPCPRCGAKGILLPGGRAYVVPHTKECFDSLRKQVVFKTDVKAWNRRAK